MKSGYRTEHEVWRKTRTILSLTKTFLPTISAFSSTTRMQKWATFGTITRNILSDRYGGGRPGHGSSQLESSFHIILSVRILQLIQPKLPTKHTSSIIGASINHCSGYRNQDNSNSSYPGRSYCHPAQHQ